MAQGSWSINELAMTPAGRKKAMDWSVSKLRVAFHWGFIPLIVYLGLTTGEPRPTWQSLFLKL